MQLIYYFYSNSSGYSIASQDYLLAIKKINPNLNIKLQYLSSNNKIGISENRYQLLESMRRNNLQDKYIEFQHCIPPRYKRTSKAIRSIGFSIFETIDTEKVWVQEMNKMDSIVTATQFNKNIFKNDGVDVPIDVVPHCFDKKLFNKDVVPKGRYDQFTFFSMGTWKVRKNFEALIKGFYTAFDNNKDNVCLVIKTDKPNELRTTVKKIKMNTEWRSKETCPIYAEDNVNCDFEQIPKIMAKGDVAINCSLGEGYGILGMHAMALNIPFITVKFGGSLEYAKSEFCTHLVPSGYEKIPIMDGIPQFRDKIWPVIRIKEIAEKMRYVHDNYKLAQKKAELAYNYIHENFSYEAIGPKMVEALGLENP